LFEDEPELPVEPPLELFEDEPVPLDVVEPVLEPEPSVPEEPPLVEPELVEFVAVEPVAGAAWLPRAVLKVNKMSCWSALLTLPS